MNLNLTLFVQMGNFFIAYLLISKMLLKPGLAVLQASDARRQQLRTYVMEEQERLLVNKNHKLELWRACQRYFKTHQPQVVLEKRVLGKAYAIKRAPELSVGRIRALTDEVAQALKKRVIHG
jgi:hypothetical protein